MEGGGKGSQMVQIPVIRLINPGDIMYSMVTEVDNNALHILELLRADIKSSHHKKKNSTTVFGGRSY